MNDNVEKFLASLEKSIDEQTFVKLTLGNYRGSDPHLQKINVRLVKTKKGVRFFFLYRSETRDTVKNYDIHEGLALVSERLDDGFRTGHLFTTQNDFQLDISKKGKTRLNVGKPTFKSAPPLDHDREKTVQIDPNSFYLKALGISDESGRVRDRERNKWKQINQFVAVLATLVDKSPLKDAARISIIDMGCGKGYLTFAAYDYFTNIRSIAAGVTGVDTKAELVELCNGIAESAGFDGLKFVVGTISDFTVGEVDVLIALHACNTATDDALFKGIAAKAKLIVAAPCCHQEIRPQIKPPAMLRDVLKHAVMVDRTAETITDGLRSLLLERSGYATKLFEFVGTEHTPKNNMLVGTRLKDSIVSDRFQHEINEIKAFYGIERQHLETLLDSR